MKYRVLAVDNDPKALLTIKYYIEMTRDDIDFFEATSCRQALRIYEKEAPDLIITELNLPDGKGQEMVLKMKETNPSLKVIVQTTETDRDYNIQIQRLLRCIDFFVKPFEMEIFADALNFALNLFSKPREEEILVVQGDSHTVLRVDEVLGGETIKGEAKLLVHVYKFKTQELKTIQLDDITLMKFLFIASKFTNKIVQCQKSYFVNTDRIQKLNTKYVPAEIEVEYGDKIYPVGKKFMKNVKKG